MGGSSKDSTYPKKTKTQTSKNETLQCSIVVPTHHPHPVAVRYNTVIMLPMPTSSIHKFVITILNSEFSPVARVPKQEKKKEKEKKKKRYIHGKSQLSTKPTLGCG